MTTVTDLALNAKIWPPLDVSKNQIRLLTIAASEDEDAQLSCDLETIDIEGS